MTIFPKQKVNLFLSVLIAGLAGAALGGGYASSDSPTFALLLGAGLAVAGLVQIYQELTQAPAPGSSDLLLGAGQLVAGGWMAWNSETAGPVMGTLISALSIFYALTVLQLAANFRRSRKRTAVLFAVVGGVAFVLALVQAALPRLFGPSVPLDAAAIALAVAAVTLSFLLPFEQQKAKEQAKALAAAQKKPQPKPLTPEEQAAKEEAARLKAEQAAKEAEARKAAEAARRARQAKEDAEAEQEALQLLSGLGGLAGKAKKKVTDTAKNTVDGFKEGLNGQ